MGVVHFKWSRFSTVVPGTYMYSHKGVTGKICVISSKSPQIYRYDLYYNGNRIRCAWL